MNDGARSPGFGPGRNNAVLPEVDVYLIKESIRLNKVAVRPERYYENLNLAVTNGFTPYFLDDPRETNNNGGVSCAHTRSRR